MKTFISLRSDFFRTCKLARSIMLSTLMGKKNQNMIVSWLIAVAFTLIADQARACSLNYTGVVFGKYDFYNDAALLSSGNIDVSCASGVGYTITLSAGNGTYEQRVMASGAHLLNYNLFTAANRALVWGDATYGSARVSGSGSGEAVNHVVYGSIPPHQNVPAGNYSDTVTVMITF
ncbi:spore coat U domain-containing protein [Amylibacter sp.]|jgi:spore coat protein U-like protein|nr:spore coat U domain-containing protein [Amylibacter sp.]